MLGRSTSTVYSRALAAVAYYAAALGDVVEDGESERWSRIMNVIVQMAAKMNEVDTKAG